MREYHFAAVAAIATLLSAPALCQAATVDVDGQAIKTLSAAVKQAQDADDGPHVINIKTDNLPTADGEVLITEPMTINGDADGNGKQADILVDISGIQAATPTDDFLGRAYIKISAPGQVLIKDLKIHPNTDETGAEEDDMVDAVRVFAPAKPKDIGNYELNRVYISGSDSANKYISLETADDIYNVAGTKMWSRQSNLGNRGIIHCANVKKKGSRERGDYELTLTDCQLGLGRGVGLNFTASSGQHHIKGGLYGHCGLEAIRVAGETLNLEGSADDRIRLVRAGNFKGSTANIRMMAFTPKSRVGTLDYVDLIPRPDRAESLSTMVPASVGAKGENVRVIAGKQRQELAAAGKPVPDVAPFAGWKTPEEAWAQAQASNKSMLLFFYSPGVPVAESLAKLIEGPEAQGYMDGCCAARVNVTEKAGQAVAQKYGVYKVPTLLVITPDAKSYKMVTPGNSTDWHGIEQQLALK